MFCIGWYLGTKVVWGIFCKLVVVERVGVMELIVTGIV